MTLDESHDEAALRLALSRWRDRYFAELIPVLIGLAAETHPEQLRKALAKVFSLECVEEMTQRVMLDTERAQQAASDTATEVRELISQVHVDLDKIDARIDGLRYEVELLERRLNLPANGSAAQPTAKVKQ